MVPVNCFGSSCWKRKPKGGKKCIIRPGGNAESVKSLHVEVEHLQKSFETANQSRATSVSVPVPFRLVGSSRCRVKVMNLDTSPVAADPDEVDYEAEDEHDRTLIVKRYNSDIDSQAYHQKPNERLKSFCIQSMDDFDNMNAQMDNNVDDKGIEIIASGHLSDPGSAKAEFWASPLLKRSCSSLAMTSNWLELDDVTPGLLCKKKKRLTEIYGQHVIVHDATSPASVRSCCSADNVILKKHSSSQVLPSRSRRLWWKLFLWSHRNLHRIGRAKPQPTEVRPSALNQQGGYASDSVEPTPAVDSSKLRETTETDGDDLDNHSWDGFCPSSGVWPHNQWVAFPVNVSPLERVNVWITEISEHPPHQGDDDDCDGVGFLLPIPPESSPSPQTDSFNLSQQRDEISHANTAIQSLNANSTVAHIAGIGLKVIPLIAHFHSLRAVNLSGNFIVRIASRSLPKGLHILNLSRNKIGTVEGLRELTRLRVLDLSYNRVSSIGQGLSNCTHIKELCLAGNKISTVEGLHRLSKLTVLDLSFNKITTTTALGQLVANYSSLIAVNLLGNPIQSNMSDNHLRKMVCSLLPKLALLNRQPINREKAREILVDAYAKAALGSSSSSRNMQRKATRRAVNIGSSSFHAARRCHVGSTQKVKQRSKDRSSSNVLIH